MDPSQLCAKAREMFDKALRAVGAAVAIRNAVEIEGERLHICNQTIELRDRNICSIGIGKAAVHLAFALEEVLGERFTAGFFTGPLVPPQVINSNGLHEWPLKTRWRWIEGGHPLPNKASLNAAQRAFELLKQANDAQAIIIFLVSGGGSAMLEWPVSDDITLANLRIANKVLVNCGASIAEINSVRRAFSEVKGGKLAARAPNCDQVTLIVSDVPQGQEWNVASGPTLAPPSDAPNGRDVIDKYNQRDQLPPSIVRAIDSVAASQHDEKTSLRQHFVLLDNNAALQAAAEAARAGGFVTEIASEISDQPIEAGCELLLHRLEELRSAHRARSQPVCLISGGEFACPVRGDGVGGRNLETALRLALTMAKQPANKGWVALCAGTDGIDGNSSAAGAIADHTTITRARAIGLDAEDFLRRSDSYSFFQELGDAITIGPTGTNVRDIRLLLAGT